MKRWFARLLTWILNKVNTPIERFDLYDPGERLLFTFFTGCDANGNKVWVSDDPMVLHKRMMDVGPELDVEMTVSRSMSKDAAAFHIKMLERIRKIFDVKLFVRGEAGGLTELETVALLHSFMTYCGAVKKNSSPSAIPQTTTSPSMPSPTAPGSSASSVAGPPTSSISGFGSVASVPSTGELTSSLKESPLPSAVAAPTSPTSEMSATEKAKRSPEKAFSTPAEKCKPEGEACPAS